MFSSFHNPDYGSISHVGIVPELNPDRVVPYEQPAASTKSIRRKMSFNEYSGVRPGIVPELNPDRVVPCEQLATFTKSIRRKMSFNEYSGVRPSKADVVGCSHFWNPEKRSAVEIPKHVYRHTKKCLKVLDISDDVSSTPSFVSRHDNLVRPLRPRNTYIPPDFLQRFSVRRVSMHAQESEAESWRQILQGQGENNVGFPSLLFPSSRICILPEN
ncbi:hypothetical protein C2S51_028847 [Perilla frutescens var. frutescens]|nr:hypothetical protein C2S51_028847 [Perilla frutescens var. frutescens]